MTTHESAVAPRQVKTMSPSDKMEANPKVALPSFKSLTQDFDRSLRIEEKIPKAPQPHQGNPHPYVVVTPTQAGPQQQQQQQHQPLTPVSAFPPQAHPPQAGQSEVHFQQPAQHPQHQQHPQVHHHQQHSHGPPQGPPQAHPHGPQQGPQQGPPPPGLFPHMTSHPMPPVNFQYRFPRSPTTGSQAQFQAPRPPPHQGTPTHGSSGSTSSSQQVPTAGGLAQHPDSNYVATSAHHFPLIEGDPSKRLPDPMTGRRMSLQIPPYPSHHSKHDSYDSQTSLSTLADIASSHTDVGEVLKHIEECMSRYRHFSTAMHEMEKRFRDEMERDTVVTGNGETRIPLMYEYADSTGRSVVDMDVERVKNFVSHIPVGTLRDIASWAAELRHHFDAWISYRVVHAPPNSFAPNPNSYETQLLASGYHPRQVQQHHRSESGSSVRKQDFSDSGRVHKKKKSVSKRPAVEQSSVALVVKPPTPVVNAASSSNQPTDAPNESLSMKAPQTCLQCGSDETPEWRRGPYGSRSLCNACGLFYSKLVKRFDVDEAKAVMVERRDRGDGADRRIPLD